MSLHIVTKPPDQTSALCGNVFPQFWPWALWLHPSVATIHERTATGILQKEGRKIDIDIQAGMNESRILPIGVQSFDDLRREGYLYVDKTA